MKRTTTMVRLGASLILAAASVLVAARADAGAGLLDATVSGGVIQRSLANADYNPSFVWQLNGELTFLPIVGLGPYMTFASSTPDITGASSVAFRTLGLRVKLKIPLSDAFQPYGVAGAGWAHGDFPDQTVEICTNGSCVKQNVPSATADFAEFLLGGGLMWVPISPFAAVLEFNWRPTAGYTNDTYENLVQSGQTTAPPPSRSGVAWVGLLGVGISL